jgi:hypothetical protein
MKWALRTSTMILFCVFPWRRLLGLAGVEDVRCLLLAGHLVLNADGRCGSSAGFVSRRTMLSRLCRRIRRRGACGGMRAGCGVQCVRVEVPCVVFGRSIQMCRDSVCRGAWAELTSNAVRKSPGRWCLVGACSLTE